MAFSNACGTEDFKTALNEPPADALPPAVGMDCKVMDVPTSAIVSGQDGTYNLAVGRGNEAHARVAGKIRLNAFPRIGIAQSDAVALLPKRKD